MRFFYLGLVFFAWSGCGKVNATCSPGLASCDKKCVDLTNDTANCGACGTACSAGQSCKASMCACDDSALTLCSGECVNAQSDSSHCGGCGIACTGGKVCNAGSCACAAPTTDCGGACVDLSNNSSNCGGCSNACSGGKTCQSSMCKCPTGQTDCSGTCVDLATSTANCGACNVACTGGKICSNGCVCPTGQSDCSGTCVDKQTNNSNCGNCGNVCTGGKSCVAGFCNCPGGQTDCSGTCTDTTIDNAHCGNCGTSCTGGKSCVASFCVCPANQGDCGGTCVNILTDRSHCGAGCSVCGPSQVCNNGCFTAPALNVLTRWNDPTGQTAPGGGPLVATLDTTNMPPGTLFKCRSGQLAGPGLAYLVTPAFANCDGGPGTAGTYSFSPLTDGTYRTEVFYQADSYQSPTVVFEYYVHHSLNGLTPCTTPAPDDAYFAAARDFSVANPGVFPLSTQFPALNSPQTRTDAIILKNPWIKIPFSGTTQSQGMKEQNGGVGFGVNPWNTTTPTIFELSLRHKYVMMVNAITNAPARSMLLMKRFYGPRTAPASCVNKIRFGSLMGEFVGPQPLVRGGHALDCRALVVNFRGDGLCFDGNNPPNPQVLDHRLVPPANLAGTVTTTAASATVTGSGTTFVTNGTWNGAFILFSGSLQWFQINSVASTTSLTLRTAAPNFAPDFTLGSQTFKVFTGAVPNIFATPTGYAKLLSQAKTLSQQVWTNNAGNVGNKCLGDPTCADGTTPLGVIDYLPP